jgi:Ion channel
MTMFSRKGFRRAQERLRDPLLTALTIMLLVLLFVSVPLQAAGMLAAHHLGIAFALVLLAAVFVVSGSLVAVVAILVGIALVIATTVLRLRHPSVVDIYLDASAWMVTGVTLMIVVGRAVFAPGQVNYHRVIGAVLLYLSIGLIFTSLFCFMALLVPKALTGLGPLRDDLTVASNLVYFSFVTLTSVGYGDIVPLHPLARSLANLEAIIGQLYPATKVDRLICRRMTPSRSRSDTV